MNPYINFLEKHLGKMEFSWHSSEEHCLNDFQVAVFEDAPFEGAATYSTLGISNFALQDAKQTTFFHEAVMVAKKEFGDENIPGILMQVSDHLVSSCQMIFRGDVIGPAGPLFEGSILEALYATAPVYFDEDFHLFQPVPHKNVIVVWLVPITKKEAAYVEQFGWEKFEDLLEQVDPDLTDFFRESIV